MNEDTRNTMRAMLAQPAPAALETLRTFLIHHVHDSDRDLLETQIRYMNTINPTIALDALEAIEQVARAQLEPGVLRDLVLVEGNHKLEPRTDEAASAWLRALATDLRLWIGDFAPPEQRG